MTDMPEIEVGYYNDRKLSEDIKYKELIQLYPQRTYRTDNEGVPAFLLGYQTSHMFAWMVNLPRIIENITTKHLYRVSVDSDDFRTRGNAAEIRVLSARDYPAIFKDVAEYRVMLIMASIAAGERVKNDAELQGKYIHKYGGRPLF